MDHPLHQLPSSETCQFICITDSESEEEGLVPRLRRLIREPEEEQRRLFIRQFEAARVKIPLRTSEPAPEFECPTPISVYDEFSFLSKEQRAEAVEEQRKLDELKFEQAKSLRLARRLQQLELKQKQEEDVREEQSIKLAESLAQRELRRQNLNVDPIKAQEKILHALTQKRPEPKDAELEWCNKRLSFRIAEEKITNASIQGQHSRGGLKVWVTINRGGLKEECDIAPSLKFYGYTEWLEIREAIQRSKSKFKGVVEEILSGLLQRMSKVVDVPPLPEKSRKRKTKDADDIEDGPALKNEHDIKFDYQSLFGHLDFPEHPMLNTSLPESREFYDNEIISHPEPGIIFRDNDGYLKFFRNSEIHKAPSKMITAMYYHCWSEDEPTKFQKIIYEKELQRRNIEL